MQVLLELRGRQGLPVQEETLDQVVRPALLGQSVQLDLVVTLASKVLLVMLEVQVPQAKMGQVVNKALQDHRDPLELLDSLDNQALEVVQEFKVNLALLEI